MAVALATPKVAGKRPGITAATKKVPPPAKVAPKANGKAPPPPAVKAKDPIVKGPGVRAQSWARGIKLIQKENPRRPGTFGHIRYELYRKVKTVGEFLGAGGTMQDLQRDAAHGYVKIEG